MILNSFFAFPAVSRMRSALSFEFGKRNRERNTRGDGGESAQDHILSTIAFFCSWLLVSELHVLWFFLELRSWHRYYANSSRPFIHSRSKKVAW